LASKGLAKFGTNEKGRLRELVINEGTVHYCSVIHQMYKQRALEILNGIPISGKCKEKLIQLVG